MRMPAWFDLYGLTPDTQEDEDGIEQSAKIIHSMIDEVCLVPFFLPSFKRVWESPVFLIP